MPTVTLGKFDWRNMIELLALGISLEGALLPFPGFNWKQQVLQTKVTEMSDGVWNFPQSESNFKRCGIPAVLHS